MDQPRFLGQSKQVEPPKDGLIYHPKGKAGEYSELACNIYRGCSHGCVYCYAPRIIKMLRWEFVNFPSVKKGFLIDKLKREAQKHQLAGTTDKILLSFTSDPYQLLDVTEQITRQTIKILHWYDLNVQVLTKGGARALRDIDLFTSNDAFATTLTFLDDSESLKWEPGASLPTERIQTVKEYHNAGIPTWVSLEPVIDPATSLEIIRQTHQFVDLFKVGKLNYHPLANTIDWAGFARDVVSLLESLGQEYYIKKDLAYYLDD